jgi:hypothetical protein
VCDDGRAEPELVGAAGAVVVVVVVEGAAEVEVCSTAERGLAGGPCGVSRPGSEERVSRCSRGVAVGGEAAAGPTESESARAPRRVAVVVRGAVM